MLRLIRVSGTGSRSRGPPLKTTTRFRDEREGVSVARTHDAEVAIVQRREDGDPPEFGDRNDAGVDQAQAQVGVALDQVDAALVVGNAEVDHVQGASGNQP